MWAVICFLCHNRTVSAGRKGSLTNDYVMHGSDGTLFQGLRQQRATSHGTRRLNQRSDYYLHGPNKDDAVLSLALFFKGKKSHLFLTPTCLSHAFKSDPATSRACLLGILFARQLYRGASVSRVCVPPKYLHTESQLHSMGGKTSKTRVQNSGFIGLCNHPEASSSLAPCLCVWQDRLLNPLPASPPPVLVLPNDEQGWLWLRRAIRCQLLV